MQEKIFLLLVITQWLLSVLGCACNPLNYMHSLLSRRFFSKKLSIHHPLLLPIVSICPIPDSSGTPERPQLISYHVELQLSSVQRAEVSLHKHPSLMGLQSCSINSASAGSLCRSSYHQLLLLDPPIHLIQTSVSTLFGEQRKGSNQVRRLNSEAPVEVFCLF